MYEQPSANPSCPACGDLLYRVRRQPLDRLLSLLSPRRRYRCASLACAWEGTIKLLDTPGAQPAAPPSQGGTAAR